MTLVLAQLQQCQVGHLGVPSYCWEMLSKLGKRTYQVHWSVFGLLRHYLAECYGVDLAVDIFASPDFSLLPKCGVSALKEALSGCKLSGHAVFIHPDWADFDIIIQVLICLQLLCIVVAPIWEQHEWYGRLLSFSSHVWFMPACNGVLHPVARGAESRIGPSPWSVVGVFADFRQKAALPVVRRLPSLERCISMAKGLKPLSRLGTLSSLALEACAEAAL